MFVCVYINRFDQNILFSASMKRHYGDPTII